MDILSFALGMNAAKGSGTDVTLVENMQIPVDFSSGNQYIEAPEGTAVKSAVIQKPENLKAENIAEGIDIAGIIGTLVAGGGGGGIVTSYKYIKPDNAAEYTFEHGLGVVPDLAILMQGVNDVSSGNPLVVINCSRKAQNAGLSLPNGKFYARLSTSTVSDGGSVYSNTLDEDGVGFTNANETTITLKRAATNYTLIPRYGFNCYFIGGLA